MMKIEERPDPAPVVPPDDFPVVWEQPGDEALAWGRDPMHDPGQALPLTFDVGRSCFSGGFDAAVKVWGLPIGPTESRHINTFRYGASRPLDLPPDQMRQMGIEGERRIAEAMLRIGDLWREKYLPELLEHLAFWEGFDLEGASAADLLALIDETMARGLRIWEIHFLVVFPAYFAVSEFDELYRDLFEPDDRFAAFRLLQGLPNLTVETGQALWRLSRTARAAPEVLDALSRSGTPEIFAELDRTEAGRAFRAELDGYLQVYGQRGDLFGITSPSWLEDPTPVLETLQGYVSQPDDADPALEAARQAQEREEALAETRELLRGYPSAARERFEQVLGAAQEGIVLTEDHGFYIDYRSMYQVRRVLVEAGRRLVQAGAIADLDDLFHLTLEEIRGVLAGRGSSDLTRAVADRRAEMQRWAGYEPPPALGVIEEGPPPGALGRSMSKFFGREPVAASSDPGEIRGHAGSAGVALGKARILRSITEAHRLQPGDVLVATTTAPPWTPLFAAASAVVTDTGGILSHCAVVAREYGIPAVVGCGDATKRISDGDVVEVDGARGVVRVVT